VPVGVPDPGADADTVAVRVTACPNTEGLWSEDIAVVLLAGFTVCVGNEPALPAKFVSPP
jgi:hypothetical protein